MRAATVMVSHYSIKTLRWRMSYRLDLEQNVQPALVRFSIHHSPGGLMPRLAAISDTSRHGLNLISVLCPSGKKIFFSQHDWQSQHEPDIYCDFGQVPTAMKLICNPYRIA